MTTRQYHNTLLERLSDEDTLTIGIGRRSEMQIDCTYCGHHNAIVMQGGSLGSYQVTCSLAAARSPRSSGGKTRSPASLPRLARTCDRSGSKMTNQPRSPKARDAVPRRGVRHEPGNRHGPRYDCTRREGRQLIKAVGGRRVARREGLVDGFVLR